MEEMIGFHYPNERIYWSFMIVLYPYITGLVAGSFITSSLYHVFDVRALRPVARMSLLAALCFLAFATMPLLLHLGHPERAFNIMITPNRSSAMAGFGFIYVAFAMMVVAELWFDYRADLIRWGNEIERGSLIRRIYRMLALGTTDLSVEAVAVDQKAVRLLAAIGIPAACILTGYVGFIFGSIKANHWWSTELMPIIFILSAIVSGIAILTLMYMFLAVRGAVPYDGECVRALARHLWFFLIVDVTIEGLEFLNMGYKGVEGWTLIRALIFERLFPSLIIVQFLLGSIVPLLLLWLVLQRRIAFGAGRVLVAISCVLVLVQVFAMRWNVVIGGQILSKSLRGFLPLHVDFLGREGVLLGLVVLALPFVLFALIARFFPPWESHDSASAHASG
ncbi:MAG: polysulfide reductase [Gemmatimonadetes bacterium]|nr:polysulfide reductase [Gemmatimonadota bacterium]